MDKKNHPPTKQEMAWAESRIRLNHEELIERIIRALPEDGTIEPFEGLFLARVSVPLQRVHSVVKPSFCVIAQGKKEIWSGNSRYVYDPDHYLIATLELPRVSQILEASPERPYLSFRLELDPALVYTVMLEGKHLPPPAHQDVKAMDVSPLDADLLDAVVRLVRLLDTPNEAPALMPWITREIIYRLLKGTQAARLHHLTTLNGNTPLIARAVERLRHDLAQPVQVEDLARELGMSVSGLHHHFKAITSMSPLQFRKQIRLQEARRLMLSEHLDAASTAYRLGYHDPAHFNREYKSLFGVSPVRDIQRLRTEMTDSTA